jgi:hypothetical protein
MWRTCSYADCTESLRCFTILLLCIAAGRTQAPCFKSSNGASGAPHGDLVVIEEIDSEGEVEFVCTIKPARAGSAPADRRSAACPGDAREEIGEPAADSEIQELQTAFAELLLRARKQNIRITVQSMCCSLGMCACHTNNICIAHILIRFLPFFGRVACRASQ